MRRISSADLVRNFSVHSDAALSEPLVITRNGRERLVLMNTEHYHEVRRRGAGTLCIQAGRHLEGRMAAKKKGGRNRPNHRARTGYAAAIALLPSVACCCNLAGTREH